MTNTHTPLNIIVYSRISMADKDPLTGELDISKVEAQERAASAWVESQGHRVAGIVRENSESAFREWGRKKFNETLRQVKAGEFDGIVSFAQDRLVRHPEEMEALIRLAERQGRLIRCLDGLFDLTTDSGRQAARLLVVFARGEVERKSKRHKDGNALRLTDGRPPQGGGRPFGFEADKVTIRRQEAALIRWATKRFIQGTSLRTLVREWNEAGISTARGKQWTRNTMTILLKRWRNAGLREHTPLVPSEAGELVRGKTVLIKAAWPAIVTPQQMAEVRDKLSGRSTGDMLITRTHLLTGIVKCGRCGSGVQATWSKHGTKKFWVYRCRGGSAEAVCSLSVRLDVVDEAVLEQATRWLVLPSSGLVNVAGTRLAENLRTERAMLVEQVQALADAEITKDFAVILAEKAAQLSKRTRVIDAELSRLAENDALAALVAEVRHLLTPAEIQSFTLPTEALRIGRARLDALRIEDLGRLRRVLRSLVHVELLPWTGTGKPTSATARQRVVISEAHESAWEQVA